jgi:hypothetical protein
MGEDNGEEWKMMDRIIATALEWAPRVQRDKLRNEKYITLVMHHHMESCGYTKELAHKFFKGPNNGPRREVLDGLGIVFPNPKQTWDVKEIRIDLELGHPHLYKMFFGSRLQHQEVQPTIAVELAAEPIQQPLPPPAPGPPLPVPVPYPIVQGVGNAAQGGYKHFTVTGRNNRQVHWFKISTALGKVKSYNTYLKAVPTSTLRDILTLAGGDLKEGVKKMTKQLHGVDTDAFLEGARECGVCAVNLDVVQTEALRDYCGLANKQVTKIGRFFRSVNNLKPVKAFGG